jgi:hypothetical protein
MAGAYAATIGRWRGLRFLATRAFCDWNRRPLSDRSALTETELAKRDRVDRGTSRHPPAQLTFNHGQSHRRGPTCVNGLKRGDSRRSPTTDAAGSPRLNQISTSRVTCTGEAAIIGTRWSTSGAGRG